jgi:hypothetical protein
MKAIMNPWAPQNVRKFLAIQEEHQFVKKELVG